jgi:hypothetical protein
MIDFLLVATVLTGAGIGLSLYAAAHAPMGYEDEQGFHFGPEPMQPIEEHDTVVCDDAMPELTR